jgi:hypothetical protein
MPFSRVPISAGTLTLSKKRANEALHFPLESRMADLMAATA